MKRTFFDLFGIDDGFVGMDFSGLTDSAIFREAMTNNSIEGDFTDLFPRFKTAYRQHLPVLLPEFRTEGSGKIMPGVKELLDSIWQRPEFLLGLATGNIREGAALKLDFYSLSHYFRDGGFGDDAEERSEVVAIAIERLANLLNASSTDDGKSEVYVIGDTPRDVQAAKANDAIAVGVATGRYSEEELRADGADLTLPDLSCSEPLLRRLQTD